MTGFAGWRVECSDGLQRKCPSSSGHDWLAIGVELRLGEGDGNSMPK